MHWECFRTFDRYVSIVCEDDCEQDYLLNPQTSHTTYGEGGVKHANAVHSHRSRLMQLFDPCWRTVDRCMPSLLPSALPKASESCQQIPEAMNCPLNPLSAMLQDIITLQLTSQRPILQICQGEAVDVIRVHAGKPKPTGGLNDEDIQKALDTTSSCDVFR